MKLITGLFCAMFAAATMGCQTTEDANEKIEDCIESEYGADKVDEMTPALALTCEDGEETCDKCVDCVVDVSCEALFAGDCADDCN